MPKRKALIEARDRKGWKQEELAKMLDMTQQTISLIENGHRNPNIRTAKKLEMLYDIPMESLFPDIFEVKETTERNAS